MEQLLKARPRGFFRAKVGKAIVLNMLWRYPEKGLSDVGQKKGGKSGRTNRACG